MTLVLWEINKFCSPRNSMSLLASPQEKLRLIKSKINCFRKCQSDLIGDPVVSLTPYVVPLRSETNAAHVYASLSHSLSKKVRYACIYCVLLANDQAKAVRELTKQVRETTSEVSEQHVGETTRRRNDGKPVLSVVYWFLPFLLRRDNTST